MNPQVKAQFIAALRSGEYQKGQGRLRRINLDGETCQYCYFGVLTDLAINSEENRQTKRLEWQGGLSVCHSSSPQTDMSFPFVAVIDWSNMFDWHSILPFMDREGKYPTMVVLNDYSDLTFDQLADITQYFF